MTKITARYEALSRALEPILSAIKFLAVIFILLFSYAILWISFALGR
jgi:cbb3-type cytochrome oxidase subunit 3